MTEPEGKTAADRQVVLPVAGSIWKLSAKPACLQGSYRQMARDPDVQPAPDAQGETVGAAVDALNGGKYAPEGVHLPQQSFAIHRNRLVTPSR